MAIRLQLRFTPRSAPVRSPCASLTRGREQGQAPSTLERERRIARVGEPIAVEQVVGARRAACLEIRRRVFVVEQRVPREEDEDGLDDEALHFLASTDGRAVGAARLWLGDGVAKAQRVAVLPDVRRGGVGRALMRALEAEARQRGFAEVVLDAQVPAIPFYERLGYVAEGDVFVEAGIPHRRMRRSLAAREPGSRVGLRTGGARPPARRAPSD
jgi:predicted GNAT family N-acyltransferase